jgi:trans-2,3-dihydro-3-hydroxyanthranilate isomerase
MLGLTIDDCLEQAPVRVGSSGVPYLLVPLRTRGALERICFRNDIWGRTARHWEAPKILAFALAPERPGSTCKLRVFAPDVGVAEEAATEMACGPLAAYLIQYGLVPSEPQQVLVFEQGAEVERPSYMHVVIERAGTGIRSVRVGGQCVSVGGGTIRVAVAGSE